MKLVDELAGLLDGPRARHAFLLRIVLEPPWSLRIDERAPLALVAMVRGRAWVMSDDGAAMVLGPGDILVTRGPDPYTLADDPATPVQVVVHPGGRCATLDGRSLAEAMKLGVRTWGNDPDGSTSMLVGTYHLPADVSRRLLGVLPPLLVLARHEWESPLVGLLSDEIVRDQPGQEAVLDRLLDLLLISALRTWLAGQAGDAPAWYRAGGDPVVGRALRLLQHNPAHPWTVASLAASCGVSRAALARRFSELVGEPPMTYLTSWRLALAADLLREPDATIGGVARQVGYGSPFALSAAFKRERGVSPKRYLAEMSTGAPVPA
jgi:AraC-like DNA-binding protein